MTLTTALRPHDTPNKADNHALIIAVLSPYPYGLTSREISEKGKCR
jgi:hypothetical protein